MTATDATCWFPRAQGIAWREVGDEAVILDVSAGEYHALNPSGRLLWTCLGDGASVLGLVEVLRKRYDVDTATATFDVEHFLARMTSLDLIHSSAT